MPLKTLNPLGNSSRFVKLIKRNGLSRPIKAASKLLLPKRSARARNTSGRITVSSRGGEHKRKIRKINLDYFSQVFSKRQSESGAKSITKIVFRAEALEYDPGRSAFVVLLKILEITPEEVSLSSFLGTLHYMIAADSVSKGDILECGYGVAIRSGNSLPLGEVPLGSKVFCLQFERCSRAILARSAGGYCEVIGREGNLTLVRMRSKKLRLIPSSSFATLGIASNVDHKNESLGKAGRSRWRGIKPHVRGVAMNPVDHPHGGGEGKTSGGRHPVSRTGIGAKGTKTRSNKKPNPFLVF